MQISAAGPVQPLERIHTIDIIRGFALLGIVIVNFTADAGDAGIYDGFTGFGDQFAYWTIRLLLDDRFQTIYCFLFGLGFALQMQRAADRNSFFGFAHLRRMIALYVISMSAVILTGEARNVLPYYATVGLLLLLFWKVPARFLPLLAILFFLLPFTRKAIIKIKADQETRSLTQSAVSVDSTILDNYVGVYLIPSAPIPDYRIIITRNKDSLIGEAQGRKFYLTPASDTQFIRKEANHILTFKKDSSESLNILIVHADGRDFPAHRIQTDFQQASKEQPHLRTDSASGQQRPTYREFVKTNAINNWNYLKTWDWKWLVNTVLLSNYKIGYILVLFLLGLYAGKRRIFQDPAANKNLLSKVFRWGLIVGGPGIAFGVGFQAWNFFNNIPWTYYPVSTRTFISLPWDIGIILVAMAYIAGMTLLVQYPVWEKRLSFFSTVGRLGLTNYILHLFAFAIVFRNSWFWGLGGMTGCVYRLLISIALYLILYLFSRLWLKFAKQGPFEWLWRSLTYLKFQPMRIKPKKLTTTLL